jgi:hypothetical protein
MMVLSSHAGDGAVESCWLTTLPSPMLKMPSHADDDATGVTWLRRNVDIEVWW